LVLTTFLLFGSATHDCPCWFCPQCRAWKTAYWRLLYRLGIENKKVKENPAKLLKHKREDNGSDRFLNQFKPVDTNLYYLKKCKDEESRLRAVILKHHAAHIARVRDCASILACVRASNSV